MSQTCDQLDQFWETRDKYERWALWVLEHNTFSTCSIFGVIVPPDGDRKRRRDHNLTTEEGLKLDACLARLIKKHPDTGMLTKSYFLSGSNYTSVSDHFKIERKRLKLVVESGIGWLDAYLDA